MTNYSRLMIALPAIILMFAGPVDAKCLKQSYPLEILEPGAKVALPDGHQVTSSAKTPEGRLAATADVKSGTVVSSGLSLDGKAGKEVPYDQLPEAAKKCALAEAHSSLSPLARLALAAMDWAIPPAQAKSCKAVLIFTAEHCIYDGGKRICGYARVYYSTCTGSYYVV